MHTNQEKNKGQNKKGLHFDIILIVSLLILSLVSVALVFIFRQEGGYVEVELDGKMIAKYSLQKDTEYFINDGSNILIIEDGVAYLSYADCPDHRCVKRGKIKYIGQSIVCLPNRVTVTVRGSVNNNQVDFVS